LGKTIGVYGLDGVRQVLLSLPPGLMAAGDFDPVWSRDGASLLVPHGVEVPLNGRTPRLLPIDDPRMGVLSPDGARVAYEREASLVVAAADGSGARVLIDAWVDNVVWSPTGDRIAFGSRTTPGGYATELRVIDLTTRAVTPLAGIGGTDSLMAREFSPDGERILFSRADRSYRVTALWTVKADGSDLRRLVPGTFEGDWQTIP
jgi:dipeptidyl aminopeptidase/acylaminoacyl peptidase